ncbi:D-alanyl-D-alanine carboxypeptidase [Lachnospiraceae bacterium KM106-2]|nr:D-alanyl-D-alanine carboxypeptidase [Lachnospiraceae bacterium KM106-2]
MNKKVIITAGAIGIAAAGILSYTLLTLHAKSSNSSKSYEYYYNKDNNTYKDNSTVNKNDAVDITKNDSKFQNPKLDTTPDSLTVLVNKELPLPSDYIPSDLTEPNIEFDERSGQKKLLRKKAATAIEKLCAGAKEEGYTITGVSGYRSYARQQEIYYKNIRKYGKTYTSQYSAAPGYSEHQTGLSMDVSSPSFSNNLDEDFINTDEGKWLNKNCYKYGFIIRFPKGKEEQTGYSYEPWHIRYVGVELATYIMKNNLCLEEYYNFQYSNDSDKESNNDIDLTISTPAPRRTARPKTTATPSPSPSAKPTTSPTTTPTKKPTSTPKPTKKPVATHTPKPVVTPAPTPVITPEPVVTPETPTQDPNSNVDQNVGSSDGAVSNPQ